MYYGIPKDTTQAKTMSNSEKIKPIVLASIELNLSKRHQSVTQSVEIFFTNSVAIG